VYTFSNDSTSQVPGVTGWAALVRVLTVCLKSCVFRQRLKVSAVVESLMLRGNQFQTVTKRAKLEENLIERRL